MKVVVKLSELGMIKDFWYCKIVGVSIGSYSLFWLHFETLFNFFWILVLKFRISRIFRILGTE